MIRTEGLTVRLGGDAILREVRLGVHPGDRLAVIGRNGSGKTTLLRVLAGELEPDAGRVLRRGGLRVGYLPQHAVAASSRPLWDEARSGMRRLLALGERLRAAEAALADDPSPAAVAAHEQAAEAFRLAGGWALDERVGEVLAGLGFRKADWRRPCDTFSGGWQVRAALAKLLLGEADLLLLDEPTNHLDLHARAWLAGFLARWPGALVVVGHDRHLLDRACNRTAEVRRGRVTVFDGPPSAWLAERDRRRAAEEAAWRAQQAEIARMERFVERFRGKPSKASQARARARALERMERLPEPDRAERAPRLVLPPAPEGAPVVASLRGVRAGWPEGPDVLREVDLELHRGWRVAVLGPNGAGKSTLLHVLAGRLRPREGRRVLGRGARVGLFTQAVARDLPAGDRALDACLAAAGAAVDPLRVRTVLGALGLSGDAALRRVGELSGGERARVALAIHVLRPRNLLLLDEPTNHLDAETIGELVRALGGWDGTAVFASHDRWFVERVATHVLHVGGGRAELREGVRPEDFEPPDARLRRSAVPAGLSDERAAETPAAGAAAHAARKAERRRRQARARQAARLEEAVHAAEARLAEVDAALAAAAAAGDSEGLARLGAERRAAAEAVEAAFERWAAFEEAGG